MTPQRKEAPALALLDLTEFQLDRRGAAEDRHRDLEAGPRLIDLLHDAVEGRERTIRDPDLLANLEGNRWLRPLDALLDLVHDALCLHLRDWRRLVACPQEARDFRGVLDEVESLVG